MPKIQEVYESQKKEEAPNQENIEKKEGEDDGEIEKPSYKLNPSARDNDTTTKEIASSVYNRMFNIEQEEVLEEEEDQVLSLDEDDDFNFNSEGESKAVTVYPSNPDVPYEIIIKDSDGHLLHSFPNQKGIYKARMKMIEGDYKISFKPQSGKVAFAVKVE